MKRWIAWMLVVTALLLAGVVTAAPSVAEKSESGERGRRSSGTPSAVVTVMGLGLLAAGAVTRRSMINRA